MAAALAATMPAAAFAQEAQPEPAPADTQPATARQGGVEDIIVTARRREERAQETPVSITAISSGPAFGPQHRPHRQVDPARPACASRRRAAAAARPRSIFGASARFRPLSMSSRRSASISTVFIRRVPAATPSTFPTSAGVEGAARAAGHAVRSQHDGRRDPALRTRNPGAEFGVKANFSYGSRNEITASSVVQVGRIGNSPFALKVSGQIHSRDGWVDRRGCPDRNGAARSTAMASAPRCAASWAASSRSTCAAATTSLTTYTGWEALAAHRGRQRLFRGAAGHRQQPAFPRSASVRAISAIATRAAEGKSSRRRPGAAC